MAWTDTSKVKSRKQLQDRMWEMKKRQKSMLLRLLERGKWVDTFLPYS